MKVKAKIRFTYGKKQYVPGNEIEMDEKDAKLLAAAGRIERDDDATTTSPKASQKRAGDARAAAKRSVAAESPEAAGDARKPHPEHSAPADDDDAKGGKKGRAGYKRRDMRASETREDSGDTGDE